MKGPNHLTKVAPSSKEATTFTQMPVVEDILKQMKEVEIIKEDRASLHSQINDINPDMKIIFKKAPARIQTLPTIPFLQIADFSQSFPLLTHCDHIFSDSLVRVYLDAATFITHAFIVHYIVK